MMTTEGCHMMSRRCSNTAGNRDALSGDRSGFGSRTTDYGSRFQNSRIQVLAILAVIAAHVAFTAAQGNARKQENWVPTWGTAQQLVRTPPPTLPTGQPPQTTTPGLAATSTTAQRGRGPAGAAFRVTTFSNQTVRMIVRTSIGGRRAR